MDVVIEPYERITIRSYLKHESPEAFANAITLSIGRGVPGRVGGLFWAKGVVFRHFPYSPSDNINKEYLNGHLPIDHLEFAPMSQFRSEIRIGEVIVTVMDVSNHLTLGALAGWIADNILDKKTKRQKTK